jgi:hypothetical protein
MRRLDSMVNRLALAVLTAAMGIGLVVLFSATHGSLRTIIAIVFVLGFAIVATLATALLFAIWRSGRN